jgi:hypothetical protein
MSVVKQIHVKRIDATFARAFVRRWHYSGKVAPNSQIHFGAFLDGKCHGVMSFGPSMDKRKIIGLVAGTEWNGFLELNRMAFDDVLPKNSESRALAMVFRIFRKQLPQIKWVVSFADACQCGDGTIYRAAGFVLTQIKENKSLYVLPDGEKVHQFSITAHGQIPRPTVIHEISMKKGKSSKEFYETTGGKASVKDFVEKYGATRLKGFQIRYIYFLDRSKIKDLQCPILPFSELEKAGAKMYKGMRRPNSGTDGFPPAEGGANPTPPLQNANGIT